MILYSNILRVILQPTLISLEGGSHNSICHIQASSARGKYLMKSTPIYGFGAKVTFDKIGEKFPQKEHIEFKELRKSPRKTVSKPTYFAIQNEYYKGVIKNLSHGGAFIETKAKFSNGIKIKLVALGSNKYFLIKCDIIHFNQTGFGVKFKSILKIKKPFRNKKLRNSNAKLNNHYAT